MEIELLLCKLNRMCNPENKTEIKCVCLWGNDSDIISLNFPRVFAHAVPNAWNLLLPHTWKEVRFSCYALIELLYFSFTALSLLEAMFPCGHLINALSCSLADDLHEGKNCALIASVALGLNA